MLLFRNVLKNRNRTSVRWSFFKLFMNEIMLANLLLGAVEDWDEQTLLNTF